MKDIAQFLNTPMGKVAFAYAVLVASAALRSMPSPAQGGSALYCWFYGFVHLLFVNVDKTTISLTAAPPVPMVPAPAAALAGQAAPAAPAPIKTVNASAK
jgi:hypothetical protein